MRSAVGSAEVFGGSMEHTHIAWEPVTTIQGLSHGPSTTPCDTSVGDLFDIIGHTVNGIYKHCHQFLFTSNLWMKKMVYHILTSLQRTVTVAMTTLTVNTWCQRGDLPYHVWSKLFHSLDRCQAVLELKISLQNLVECNPGGDRLISNVKSVTTEQIKSLI